MFRYQTQAIAIMIWDFYVKYIDHNQYLEVLTMDFVLYVCV